MRSVGVATDCRMSKLSCRTQYADFYKKEPKATDFIFARAVDL